MTPGEPDKPNIQIVRLVPSEIQSLRIAPEILVSGLKGSTGRTSRCSPVTVVSLSPMGKTGSESSLYQTTYRPPTSSPIGKVKVLRKLAPSS